MPEPASHVVVVDGHVGHVCGDASAKLGQAEVLPTF
jgi:hypothetical protein